MRPWLKRYYDSRRPVGYWGDVVGGIDSTFAGVYQTVER